jgi:hypothetical protein
MSVEIVGELETALDFSARRRNTAAMPSLPLATAV